MDTIRAIQGWRGWTGWDSCRQGCSMILLFSFSLFTKLCEKLVKKCWEEQRENHLGSKELKETWGEEKARHAKPELCTVERLHRVRRETWWERWESINTSQQQQWRRELITSTEDSKTKWKNWCWKDWFHISPPPDTESSGAGQQDTSHQPVTVWSAKGQHSPEKLLATLLAGSACGSVADWEPLEAQGQSLHNCILRRRESCFPPNKPVCSWV